MNDGRHLQKVANFELLRLHRLKFEIPTAWGLKIKQRVDQRKYRLLILSFLAPIPHLSFREKNQISSGSGSGDDQSQVQTSTTLLYRIYIYIGKV